ncbi:hypothetical protein IMCC1989_1796 [gamma proteobacterium IMCC1989]|nr:hypothetical protein IMCC1989_1796 [gamma proteobacterium IMCC1989]
MAKLFLLFAAINGMIAVVLGAFGAHALKASIGASLLSAYQTGIQYHFIHVLALVGLALFILRLPATVTVPLPLVLAGCLWMAGVILFSGSLYGIAIGAPSWFGPITPLGGLLLIVGWLCFAVGIARSSV